MQRVLKKRMIFPIGGSILIFGLYIESIGVILALTLIGAFIGIPLFLLGLVLMVVGFCISIIEIIIAIFNKNYGWKYEK